MRLRLVEDPKEWRKAACFSALGLTGMSCVLRWRRVLPQSVWLAVLIALAVVAVTAWIWPHAFRGWHHLTKRVSFFVFEVIGRGVLAIFFFLLLTPFAIIMRVLGKDPLRLKPSKTAATYWEDSKASSPFDQLF